METAGGVLSPGPSGTLQADIYRPLRLPTVLVADHKLGGIGSTISAAESLITRGYDIDAVVCFDDKSRYQNAEYLVDYFKVKMGIAAYSIPWIPDDLDGKGEREEQALMKRYYEEVSLSQGLTQAAARIVSQHQKRVGNIDSMASRTFEKIWHPFTQHKHVKEADDILVFDSAFDNYFQVNRSTKLETDSMCNDALPMLLPAFDGSASWWTQGRSVKKTAYGYALTALQVWDMVIHI